MITPHAKSRSHASDRLTTAERPVTEAQRAYGARIIEWPMIAGVVALAANDERSDPAYRSP